MDTVISLLLVNILCIIWIPLFWHFDGMKAQKQIARAIFEKSGPQLQFCTVRPLPGRRARSH
ncbi:MAG: hypothetical protein RDV48_00090 [Candidatus Eremiobacteraeota bacterium]|nr:hypothetical protein [Candidatus Eremiobacteraeota bacterium]